MFVILSLRSVTNHLDMSKLSKAWFHVLFSSSLLIGYHLLVSGTFEKRINHLNLIFVVYLACKRTLHFSSFNLATRIADPVAKYLCILRS